MPAVLVVYTERAYTPNQEYIAPDQVSRIAETLRRSGWDAGYTVYRPAEIHRTVSRRSPQVIFNLAYGFRSRLVATAETQPQTAERLESTGAACVGSAPATQVLAQDKVKTAELLSYAGIRSPRRLSAAERDAYGAPCVIKPRYGACHRGVRLIWPEEDLQPALARGREEYLIQEYVDGPEYSVALLCRGPDLIALPPVQICFERAQPGPKLMDGSRFAWSYKFDKRDRHGLRNLSRQIFRLLGLRDYARIDFRIGPGGPVVLDVNALPNLHPEISLFPKAAAAGGVSYESLICELAASAYSRTSGRVTRHAP
jgi:D-alanine-D-alanine ligase